MALYEYQCLSCGDLTEVIQRMSDPPLTTCEKCGGDLKKLISAPAFQFKGTGWYVTDYADKKGKSGDEKAGSKGSDSGDSDSKGSSESKDSGSSSSDSSSLTKSESKSESKSKPEKVASKD